MNSVSGTDTDVSAVYETLTAQRANDQQRIDGQNALRLIEAAQAGSAESRPLPPDATISIRA